MPKIKQIDIKAIFEQAIGRKVDHTYMQRVKKPTALGPITTEIQKHSE